ncbi:coagulation factor IIIa [Cheilinus undulatus]|uniref:coagulation factor IIIa n=1 Tax=Cheilinus undulatus TaxID=241271 RepID=UPI001BD2AF88|nr:coagulation factor IIIa [Cheilinus undulatus]
MTSAGLPAALWIVLLQLTFSASGSYPRAQNVTWQSVNFKTLLTWQPKPAPDYTYTVDYYGNDGNKKRNTHCIRSSDTVCDLSSSLTDVKDCYTADVSSEPPLGVTSDLVEFPHTSSPRFCPYTDTDIGRPDFKVEVSKDKRTTTLYVTDPLTARFKDGRQLNIRDIFSDELKYKVTYRKNKSSGKKFYISDTNRIELTTLDRGESYCFEVQAFIPSRSINKQLGELSIPQCSDDDGTSLLEEYSVVTIAVFILLFLLLIGIIIAVTVVCYKRRQKALRTPHLDV